MLNLRLAGFRGSVFNLVFVNNIGSLRIWDQLGFTRAGLIPNAALLKTADGKGEEYVDAVVYHKDLTQGLSSSNLDSWEIK